jgi:hypothetical protein
VTPGGRLTTRRRRPKMAGLEAEPRGEVVMAPGSQRPASVIGVTRHIIVPALLERLLADSSQGAVS